MSKRETAYHEAGHAVVAVALRIPLEEATIRPDYKERAAGHVTLSGQFVASLEWTGSKIKVRKYAAQAAAGVVASWLFTKRRCPTVMEFRRDQSPASHYHSDYGLVCDAALSILGPSAAKDSSPVFERALGRAERILSRNWPAVRAVAAALLKRETLTADEVRALVKRAPARSGPS